ncbi:MAG TPA: hypothetical protein ENI44_04540, partial [Thermoplasmatales archaeon]|nr:hypothetical protein [Thermoplasmatales archaeon]
MKRNLDKLLVFSIIIFIEFSNLSISQSDIERINQNIEGSYRENLFYISNKAFPCGSAGPIIGMLLERWAKIIKSYHTYPKEYLNFEIVREMMTDRIENVDIITVDENGKGNYTTIQDAIDHAKTGDAILVYSGVYSEEIVVYKPLWIIGVGKEFSSGIKDEKPLINSHRTTILITANNTTFYGFKIKGSIG